jgi:hypothetical protein
MDKDIGYTCCTKLSFQNILKDFLSHIGNILFYFLKFKYLTQKDLLSHIKKT